jgi:gliding motility-associated-like protein
MKQTVIISLCIIAAVFIARCKKSDSAPVQNLATCTTCSNTLLEQTPDTLTGAWYYLPTAFTPNGDGLNDVFQLYYSRDKFNVDSSTITIWDLNGNGVFKGNINERWDGKDLKGVRSPTGHYPLYLKLRTTAGVQITACGCVSILAYKGTCIFTGGVRYYLPDELDTARGFTYPTYDHLCP